jgi:hypothetical protein
VWLTSASLLFASLLIIALHPYWSSVAAVIISLFGRTLAIRGAMLMAAPARYERAATSVEAPRMWLVFTVVVAAGLYLTYVGSITKPGLPPAVNEP